MNMNPDETTIALWLDDELTGEELAAMDTWAVTEPAQLKARAEIRHWRETISAHVDSSVEPPHGDFFNSRIMQTIRDQAPVPTMPAKRIFLWRSWFMPATACVGMILTFWVGKLSQSPTEFDVTGAPRAIIVDPVLYTPDISVDAEWFASSEASATVIVLNGTSAIPDTLDFSETVGVPMVGEIQSTADRGSTSELEVTH